MKRMGCWAIGIAAFASASLAGPVPLYAGERDHPTKCTLATLKGQYLFATSGTLFPPAFGVTEQSVSEAAGYSVYNGDGTGTDFVTFTVDGVNVGVPSSQSTKYTLSPDCTGTRTVLPDGPHFNIFVAIDGSALTEISTDKGFAVSSFDKRVGSSD
jgi:hypothetical protein